jgi:hypothetical protein
LDYKTGRGINYKEKWYQISLYSHIPCILRKWGFKQKIPRKVHVNTASVEEKEDFKKRLPRYLWISSSSSNAKMKIKNDLR